MREHKNNRPVTPLPPSSPKKIWTEARTKPEFPPRLDSSRNSTKGQNSMYRKATMASRIACFLAISAMAFGADGDKSRTKGMIMTRTGESIIVNTPGGKVTVMLTDNTKTKDDRGLFGL